MRQVRPSRERHATRQAHRQGGSPVRGTSVDDSGSVPRTGRTLFVSTLVLTILLLTTTTLAQQTALLVSISFLPNGSATFDNVQVTFAGIDQQSTRPLQDSIQLVIAGDTYYSTSIPVTFTLLTDPPVAMPAMSITQHLPYYGNKGVLKIVHDNKTIASFDLAQLCNDDKHCTGFENGLSCPADCDNRVSDGVCVPVADGGCDPDCAPALDPDCAPQVKTPPSQPMTIALFMLVLLIIALFYAYNRYWGQRR